MTLRPRGPCRRPQPVRATMRRSISGAPARRTRSIRRASAGLSPVRAGAILAMLVAAVSVYGVAQAATFQVVDTQVEGASFTDPAAIVAAMEPAKGTNMFALVTRPLEDAVRSIPTVRGADVSARLPGTLVVRIRERTPILVWRIGARRYLVDSEGRLFAKLPDDPPAGTAGLPVIDDRRAAMVDLVVGSTLDRVDLDAATRLGSLVPADVGSVAERLLVFISDQNGFTIRTDPASWQAVFGFYTPTLRTPELVPGQVRLLHELLLGREPLVDKIILASETDGTFIPKPTPTPSGTPAP
jgi:cell division septal protein FtsQ